MAAALNPLRPSFRTAAAGRGGLRLGLLFALLVVPVFAQPAREPSRPPQPPQGGPFERMGNENDLGGSLVRTEGSGIIDEDQVKTAREVASHSTGTPEWTNPRGFEKDVFTFARAIFKAGPTTSPSPRFHRGRRIGWWVDFPDADLNLSYRLQQMTSTRVDPDGRVLKLTNPDLHNYPFLFMEHPGYMILNNAEVEGLRKYLLAGGVLAVIDFWNSIEWEGFAAQMKRVLPGREWVELGMDHPIFNCVFQLKGPMQRLQVPTMQFWNRSHNPEDPGSPLQIDRGPDSDKMSVRALYDDKGRMMAIAFHNTDISDGWEREGENAEYFSVFSERVSYPIGVTLIFYLMTH
jgi:hypothetical protein